jgi:hypothetical protein
VRRSLKILTKRLEERTASSRAEVFWVDVDAGETANEVIQRRYGDQVPSGIKPITVSWMQQNATPTK